MSAYDASKGKAASKNQRNHRADCSTLLKIGQCVFDPFSITSARKNPISKGNLETKSIEPVDA